jgi:hypothetical protein
MKEVKHIISIFLFLSLIIVTTSCSSGENDFTDNSTVLESTWFTSPTATFIRPSLYDYGASVIKDGNLTHFWWCGEKAGGTDAIFYGQYNTSENKYYLHPGPVLEPTYLSSKWDGRYVCDPSVVKGVFKNPEDGKTYSHAMYYTATDRFDDWYNSNPPNFHAPQPDPNKDNRRLVTDKCGVERDFDGTNNRIGVAFSNDGIIWVPYSKPIISGQFPHETRKIYTHTYGVGQAMTYNADGKSAIWIVYTDETYCDNDKVSTLDDKLPRLRTSTDGINFGPPIAVSKNGITEDGVNVAPGSGGDIAFDYVNDYWYGVWSFPGRTNDIEASRIALARMPGRAFPSGTWEVLGYINTNLTNDYLTHTGALVRDKWGNINATLPVVEVIYTGGKSGATRKLQTDTWELKSVKWQASPNTVAFKRYYNGQTNFHRVTTGAVGTGFAFEQTLGYLFMNKQPNTKPLVGCRSGVSDYFISTGFSCEGTTMLGINGFIYSSSPSSISTVALYRCRTNNDHFVSTSSTCEGQTKEILLGYAKTQP